MVLEAAEDVDDERASLLKVWEELEDLTLRYDVVYLLHLENTLLQEDFQSTLSVHF